MLLWLKEHQNDVFVNVVFNNEFSIIIDVHSLELMYNLMINVTC